MRGLEHIIVRGDKQPLCQAGIRFGGKDIVHLAGTFDIGNFIIIFGMLELFPTDDLTICHPRAPFLIPDGFGIVQGDQNALEPVGDLHRNRVERHTTHLLEVGELRDLLPIQPDFPAQPPGGDGGLLPVVLHEADVMLARIDAESFKRFEVKLLRISWVRLKNDLKLRMFLEPVGVLAVATIVRADRRFDIGDIPRFGAEDPQKSSWVHRPGTNLRIVWLGDQASVRCPEVL